MEDIIFAAQVFHGHPDGLTCGVQDEEALSPDQKVFVLRNADSSLRERVAQRPGIPHRLVTARDCQAQAADDKRCSHGVDRFACCWSMVAWRMG